MYKFVFLLVLLLATSASMESCAGNGLMCVYEDYCCSGYCNYYVTPTTDDFGRCDEPPPNWGHCGYDGDECVNNDDCCSYTCWNYQGNRSYCVPPPRPASPNANKVVFAPVPAPVPVVNVIDPAPTPSPTQFPIETAPAPAPGPNAATTTSAFAPAASPKAATATPAHAPSKMKRKHKSRKSRRPKCPTTVAPTPSHHKGK